ncbi:secreted RxLR effector protein 161-like [Nicotiana tabacum]|uniref:Secreted RxLR effector protein 161-like n=1 Tax=Nicotiana tabacum TaxID=4097 RepID=A0AC58UHQ0_TOBAC
MGSPLTDLSTYQRIIGKLNFLQHTRPDISFCVQHLSQFLQAPQVPHMLAALYALRYLSNAPALGILLSFFFDTSIKAYSNSDWTACAESRRSVSGFYITLGGSPISWKSKKQPTISLSSAEAEYLSLRKVVAEVSWLVRTLDDLGLHVSAPAPIFCDSLAALHIAKNPIFHERTKYIEIDCHYVRESLNLGLIFLHFVPSFAQLADIMTKPLPGPLHHSLLGKLGVLSPPSLRGGGVDIHIGQDVQIGSTKPNR